MKIIKLLTQSVYESVISITGTVVARSPETVNDQLSTGGIEVIIDEYTIHSRAGNVTN